MNVDLMGNELKPIVLNSNMIVDVDLENLDSVVDPALLIPTKDDVKDQVVKPKTKTKKAKTKD